MFYKHLEIPPKPSMGSITIPTVLFARVISLTVPILNQPPLRYLFYAPEMTLILELLHDLGTRTPKGPGPLKGFFTYYLVKAIKNWSLQ